MGVDRKMKNKYAEDLDLDLENGHDEPYFVAHTYDIDVNNMVKRSRVFINQLLPGIVMAAHTKEDIEFSFGVLGRHVHRFIPKLVDADIPDELLMVAIAVSETITQLLKKQQELVAGATRAEHTRTHPKGNVEYERLT